MKKDAAHPAFALRFEQACEGNSNIPGKNYGRLAWFVDRLAERGVTVSDASRRSQIASNFTFNVDSFT